jgi:hypothetical protein
VGSLAVFAIPAAIALALSSSSLRSKDAAGPVIALALISFAGFDVPLSALSALAAAIWLPLLASDPRAMWQSLALARADRGPRSVKPETTSPE